MSNGYIKEGGELTIFKSQDLTKSEDSVNKEELRKYWDRDYINGKINEIDNIMHRELIRFLWMSGIRISEAINLKKQDIDFNNYLMTVRWLKSRKYHQRVLPIHPNLKNIIQVYAGSKKADELMFPISRQRAWQLTQKYLGGHPHQLRHSFAVNWLRCGGDIVMLHKILGHARIQTTMEYLKIVPIDQGKELIKIQF